VQYQKAIKCIYQKTAEYTIKTKHDHKTKHSTALGMQASIRLEHRKSYEKLEGEANLQSPTRKSTTAS
jgi:hypothetical protein